MGQATLEERTLSSAARRRMEQGGEPLLLAAWERAVFFHYQVDPAALQAQVPLALDLYQGQAYVSLVAFLQRRFRFRRGGLLGALLTAPVRNHAFFNLRTYVREHGEPGIFFMAEWLPNLLSVAVGPLSFGLPCRPGRLAFHHEYERGVLWGEVTEPGTARSFRYSARLESPPSVQPSPEGSLQEFLLERYAALTEKDGVRRLFRIWHQPWPQAPIAVQVLEDSLLAATGEWHRNARLVGANLSPGVPEVWIGRPVMLGRCTSPRV